MTYWRCCACSAICCAFVRTSQNGEVACYAARQLKVDFLHCVPCSSWDTRMETVFASIAIGNEQLFCRERPCHVFNVHTYDVDYVDYILSCNPSSLLFELYFDSS